MAATESDLHGIDQSFRDSIATIDSEGKRKWIYPKKPKGKLYNYRTYVSWGLLLLLFSGPWIRIGGEPILMLNILERKFVIFGQIFWPQDFHLFVLAMLAGVIFITLFTIAFGRLFCGWICPQTIFMEMVFRKIEYWIEGDFKHQAALDKMPWNAEKIRKKVLKHGIFYLISVAIANTFLAYIIGSDELLHIQTDNPANHVTGLVILLIFSAVFYGVFAKFREQACIVACPYGRLQGVLLDRNSLVVAYNYVRGETRGKFRKNEKRSEVKKGDCIDCGHCVDVCPTGIDIRNGTQLECVNCTACIDACDNMMEAVDLPKGLISYYSENSIEKNEKFTLTNRLKFYITVLTLLVSFIAFLLITRTDIETVILRTPGQLYQKIDDEHIGNMYNFKIVNKTNHDMKIDFSTDFPDAEIRLVGTPNMDLKKQEILEGTMFIVLPKTSVHGKSTKLELIVNSFGKEVDNTKLKFLGPLNI